jgi:3-dehydroquinate synthase
MSEVSVQTASGHYPVRIGTGRLDRVGQSVPDDATAIVVVTNPTVNQLFGDRVRASLHATGKPTSTLELPEGEEYKSWQTLNLIFDHMLGLKLDRRVVILALGGGVIGDMAGFAAAVYMRGVRFIQVPTTLLAQVDSSVGGKTAVNHPLGKNMIGAFYQPIAVEIDTDVLKTLPDRELSAGLAEVVKYGLIMDEPFFQWCEEHAQGLRARDPELISYAIERSCQFKATVVCADERESGLRAILNFGHTFAHTIEAGMGYGQWLHGEAVGCGMVLASALSNLTLGLRESDVLRVKAIVQAIGCPIRAPRLLGVDQWLSLMQSDKKAQGGEIKYVLLSRIGQAQVCRAATDDVTKVLSDYTGEA